MHKEHEINEIKTLNITKIKNDIKKYKKNFKKHLEKNKILEINNFKSDFSKYSSISEIEEVYKLASKNISRYLNIINDLIYQYELYIKYYQIPSYNFYQNIKLIYKCYNDKNLIYCFKYQYEKDLIKIDNYKNFDCHINKSVYEKGFKYGCGLYKDEVGDLIYVYYNLDKEILFFFNLETWNYKKETKIEIDKIKNEFEYYFIFFKLNNIELFLVYEKKQNTISIYDIKVYLIKKIFFREIDSAKAGKVYINNINSRILIFFITSYLIYVFNINNQIVFKLCTNKINLKSILFFEIKPFGKMLFFSNDNEGIIYKLKIFQLLKKYVLKKLIKL